MAVPAHRKLSMHRSVVVLVTLCVPKVSESYQSCTSADVCPQIVLVLVLVTQTALAITRLVNTVVRGEVVRGSSCALRARATRRRGTRDRQVGSTLAAEGLKPFQPLVQLPGAQFEP